MNSPIIFSHACFDWPDGSLALSDLTVTFSTGRTGLVGDNGSGKTTILRLIAGQLTPTRGHIDVHGDIAYLPQMVISQPGSTLADLLGVSPKLAALRAIEAGSVDTKLFDLVGDDWNIRERATQVLHELGGVGGGLADAGLDREATTLSGGEAMVVAVAGCRLRDAPITMLDEPTNNLDQVLRQAVVEMVRTWPGTVLVVSHDRDLLESMDAIAEARDHQVTIFGGPYSQFVEAVSREQAAAVQAEKTAEQALRVARHQRVVAFERTAKNLARGKQKAIKEGMGKGSRDAMRGIAEDGAGRTRGAVAARVDQAETELTQAAGRVRQSDRIRIDLPDPEVHASKTLAEFRCGTDGQFILRGPARVALTGRNGVGKTTMLEQLMSTLGRSQPSGGWAGRIGPVIGTLMTDRVGYLPQRYDLIDDAANAIQVISEVAPQATSSEIRAQLARLLIRGDTVFRPVSTLSGGERFRVGLARLLLGTPPPQLLILDEPTNNIDLTSVDQLVDALESYRGAILIVSHHSEFLSRVGVTTELELTGHGLSVHPLT
ncbi:MAG: ATP-binding cassette domain-containing protein [Propionibacteriaceae bacterium]|jgi:ATPase subunit of ABC transporter with duplicated ATPase domains|nr:ATP-binding cassette domain-containing protein [Propionibacteriaceae bacterium]